jgi:hypothetical protein
MRGLQEDSMVDEARCEELRDALNSLRARIAPLDRDFAVAGVLGAIVITPSAIDTAEGPNIEQEIRSLEKALRDEGCEVS